MYMYMYTVYNYVHRTCASLMYIYIVFSLFAARYCCIYCRASKAGMQQPKCQRGPCQIRTLKSINHQYDIFVNDGQQRMRANDISYSVVNRPMLEIEVDHVSLLLITFHDNLTF